MDPNGAIEIVYPNNNNNNLRKRNKKEIKVERQGWTNRGREWRGERFFNFYFLLFSSFSDFRRSRRQSWPTQRELRVGTKSLAFRQTPKDREFSYLSYF